MVRQPPRVRLKNEWENTPMPILVVEVLSPFTRRRDHMQKRRWYTEIGVSEYWIVDPEGRTVTVVKSDADDHVARDTLRWDAPGVGAAFECRLVEVFGA